MTHLNDNKKPSIKRNTITNYLGQGYTIGAAILFTPFYLQFLGAEAYGLVGFYMVMQSWFSLLDMGFSATLGRQVAYARSQTNGFDEKFLALLKTFELIFIVLTSSIIVSIYCSSNWVAHNWIKPITLNPADISYCISVMGLIIGLRLFSTIYRSGINGFEDQVWINKVGIIINTIKYIGSLLILIIISKDVTHFFEYQLVIGMIEVAFIGKRFYHNLPPIGSKINFFKFDWRVLKKILPFTLSITYTSTILIVITQLDKLLLSGVLSLEEFGYFSLTVMIAGAIISLSIPVFLAFLPRLTLLAAGSNSKELIATYVNMTQIITWVTISSAMVISNFSQEILYALTGDWKAQIWGEKILIWYALGSCIYVLGTFQYYLQNAFGKLRLYVIGSTIALAVQTPLIYFVTNNYGALGSGQLWFAFSVVWFLGWTAVVHNNLLPGFHTNWLIRDLLPMAISIIAASFVVEKVVQIDMNASRTMITIQTAFVAISFLTITSLSVRTFREKIIQMLRKEL